MVDDLHSSVGLFGESFDGLFQGLLSDRQFSYELGKEKLITHFLAEMYGCDWNARVLHTYFTWRDSRFVPLKPVVPHWSF